MPLTPPPTDLLPEKPGLLIGDEMVTATAHHATHRYAATGEVTREIALAGPEEVDAAVGTARAALPGWSRLPVDQRRTILFRCSEAIAAHSAELVALHVLDNGSPHLMVAGSPAACADWFAYNAGWADKVGGDVIPTWDADAFDYTIDEPYGVVGILIPWNGPIHAIGMTVAPALAAGNTVVLKPPELAPYSAVRIGQILLEAGLPPGVLNVIPSGAIGGEALCGHPGVDKLHFTGGAATARKVLTAAQANLTPVGLELGGKSANLVFADADLDRAALFAISGAMILTGQGCMNGTRILVEASAYDKVIGTAAAILSSLPQGDPLQEQTVLGPVVSEAAAERILGFVTRATADGARLVTGGTRLGGDLRDGWFVAPTILGEVDPQSEVAQQEIFGPVLSFIPFQDEDEAVALANATTYGLAAYISTNDLRRAHRVARALEAGTVLVNEMAAPAPGAPFGGNKQSGHGRLGGAAGIREFTRPKNVRIPL